jgi:hypothetical protein
MSFLLVPFDGRTRCVHRCGARRGQMTGECRNTPPKKKAHSVDGELSPQFREG